MNISTALVFQYISCYSLSRWTAGKKEIKLSFQYISCYSLSEEIPESLYDDILFQYISCYSLSCQMLYSQKHNFLVSIHLMLLFIRFQLCPLFRGCSFNTSHVTLYQQAAVVINNSFMFQYISCYSLSFADKENHSTWVKFQYISCYSLS